MSKRDPTRKLKQCDSCQAVLPKGREFSGGDTCDGCLRGEAHSLNSVRAAAGAAPKVTASKLNPCGKELTHFRVAAKTSAGVLSGLRQIRDALRRGRHQVMDPDSEPFAMHCGCEFCWYMMGVQRRQRRGSNFKMTAEYGTGAAKILLSELFLSESPRLSDIILGGAGVEDGERFTIWKQGGRSGPAPQKIPGFNYPSPKQIELFGKELAIDLINICFNIIVGFYRDDDGKWAGGAQLFSNVSLAE
jgi:hypothetical protein